MLINNMLDDVDVADVDISTLSLWCYGSEPNCAVLPDL